VGPDLVTPSWAQRCFQGSPDPCRGGARRWSESGGRFEALGGLWRAIVMEFTISAQPSISTC
jgi:hypothetical protein